MKSKQHELFSIDTAAPSRRPHGVASSQARATLEVIVKAYHAGILGGITHEVYPDIDRNSLHWRLYFSLPCAINYQRKSEGLWKSALRTYNDATTRFVFDCANVALGEASYRAALSKHGLAVQREKQAFIWFRFSETLYRLFDGDPWNLFSFHNFDVVRIKEYIVAHKHEFPYVSGPKLLNYWLYIFSHFTDVPFRRKEEISVIPDVHVKRATVALGLMSDKEVQDTDHVAMFWSEFLRGTPYAPCDLHAPLWRWSRAGLPSKGTLLSALELSSSALTNELRRQVVA